MSPLQLSNSIIKNHSPRPKPAVPNKIITEDESSLPPACALSFAQNSTRRVKFVSWKPKKQSCWFPMGALGSFRSSESAQPHVRLRLQSPLGREAASGPLIPLLQAGMGSPAEEAPTHRTCQTRSQEGAGGRGQDSGHDSMFSYFCLHTFQRPLLWKPQARSSGQVSKPSLAQRSSNLDHGPLDNWKTEGPKDLHMICVYHYLFYETLKKNLNIILSHSIIINNPWQVNIINISYLKRLNFPKGKILVRRFLQISRPTA